jgi:uncharacterized protein
MRTLSKVRLMDVAPVNSPAYEDTSVGARSIDSALASLALKFSADVAEVRKLSEANELTKFFKRTDSVDPQVKRRSAQAALAAIAMLDPNAKL